MIISASYRTDIPAFYGDWFIARLEAGNCRTVTPYNHNIYQIRLDLEVVSGFVFWTKNLGPFYPTLQLVNDRGFPFVVQFTINAYPRELETAVIDAERAIGHMRDLAGEFGLRVCVWRYDPVVATSVTPPDWHVGNFSQLADRLVGASTSSACRMSLAGRSQHVARVIGQTVCVRNRAISAITTRAHTVASIAMQCGTLRSLGGNMAFTTLVAPFCRNSGEAYLGRNHALVKQSNSS